MRIKRFKAVDMKQAIKMVREEHGADAVILSNRKVKDGIEIISAIDYDENAVEKMLLSDPQNSNFQQTVNSAPHANVANHSVDESIDSVDDFNVDTQDLDQMRQNGVAFSENHELDDNSYSFSAAAQQKSNSYKNAQGYANQEADASVNTSAGHNESRNLQSDHSRPREKVAVTNTATNADSLRRSTLNQIQNPAQVSAVPQPPVKPIEARQPVISVSSHSLEVIAMQRELDTLKGILNTQIAQPTQLGIQHIHPSHNGIYARLQELGIRSELCHEILQQLPLSSEVNEGWRKALALLAHRIDISDEDILETGGVVALVGPTGVGKTTTIAKLAARFALKHGRSEVALVSTDNYRIAAQEQIISYGKMIGVPVYLAADNDQFKTILSDLYDKQLVLIDTAGIGQRDKRINEQLETLASIPYDLSTYLVLSANTQESALNQIAKTYSQLNLSGVCLTKIDETVSLGGLLSIIVKYEFSIAYLCEGQRVPEDIVRARPYSLVSKAVTLMQQAEILSNSNTNTLSRSEELYNAHAS